MTGIPALENCAMLFEVFETKLAFVESVAIKKSSHLEKVLTIGLTKPMVHSICSISRTYAIGRIVQAIIPVSGHSLNESGVTVLTSATIDSNETLTPDAF